MKPQKRKLKLTEWYSCVNPMRSRPGLYQCACCMDYLLWENGGWHWTNGLRDWQKLWQPNIKWRGVSR